MVFSEFWKDPSDKRRILCDDKLKELFEVDSFLGLSMSKFLAAHLIKMEQWVTFMYIKWAPKKWAILRWDEISIHAVVWLLLLSNMS